MEMWLYMASANDHARNAVLSPSQPQPRKTRPKDMPSKTARLVITAYPLLTLTDEWLEKRLSQSAA
jgi:hypothetical protein